MNLNINFMSTFFGIITNFFNCMTINNCKKQLTDMKVKIYCINEVLKLLKTESVAKADNPLKTGFVSGESKAGNYVKRGSAVRHITLFAALALGVAAMPALTSCEKEKSINSGVQSGEKITLIATVEQPGDAQAGSSQVGNTTGTKTSLGELSGGTNPVNWSASDAIKVFATSSGTYETTGAEFTTVGTGKKVDFTGTLASGAAPLLAYYPASGISSITSAGEMTVTLRATQTYKANSFGEESNPMAGYSADGTTLAFKNICGVIKLGLYCATTTKVKKIYVSSTQKLSGTGTVNYNSGSPTLTMSTGASNEVVLDCSAEAGGGVTIGTAEASATPFYIAIPVSSGDSYGFVVTVETTADGSGNTMTKTAATNSSNKIIRSTITKMAAVAYTADAAPHYVEKGVDKGAGTSVTGGSPSITVVWAPVNCGYEPATTTPEYKGYPYGKLYQWGRKDGQGYDSNDATTPSVVEGKPDKLASAVANTFYKGWDNTIAPDGTWGTSDPWKTKTTYDPCPTGWRVPTKAELEALLGGTFPSLVLYNSQYGAWFNGTTSPGTSGVFLPAAGYRLSDGDASGRGSFGLYWSSTPNGDNAYFLYFDNGNALMDINYRAYGFSVRCVKD